MQQSFVNFLAKSLDISSTEDWYAMTMKIVINNIEKKIDLKFSTLLEWVKNFLRIFCL